MGVYRLFAAAGGTCHLIAVVPISRHIPFELGFAGFHECLSLLNCESPRLWIEESSIYCGRNAQRVLGRHCGLETNTPQIRRIWYMGPVEFCWLDPRCMQQTACRHHSQMPVAAQVFGFSKCKIATVDGVGRPKHRVRLKKRRLPSMHCATAYPCGQPKTQQVMNRGQTRFGRLSSAAVIGC